MAAKRWLIIIWLAVFATAAVFVWQLQHENSTATAQSTGPSTDTAGQPSAVSVQPTHAGDKTIGLTFNSQVLRYYEISNTENQGVQKQLLPSVATKRFLDSYQWIFPSDSQSLVTTVDATRSSVEFEESPTSKNIRYVTTRAYVIKVDTSSNERYEELYPADYTTWIIEDGGTWKIYGPTVTTDVTTHTP